MSIELYPPLNLPQAALKISKKENQYFVWCEIRKNHLVLTPEEWVRQHAIHFLIHQRNVPIGKIASETLVVINNQNRRCDLVVVDDYGNPKLIVECKATSVSIDDKTLLQTSNYVRQTNASFFWMTNGLHHVVVDRNNPDTLLEEFPVL